LASTSKGLWLPLTLKHRGAEEEGRRLVLISIVPLATRKILVPQEDWRDTSSVPWSRAIDSHKDHLLSQEM